MDCLYCNYSWNIKCDHKGDCTEDCENERITRIHFKEVRVFNARVKGLGLKSNEKLACIDEHTNDHTWEAMSKDELLVSHYEC